MDYEFIIYALVDPFTEQVRYIGKSSYGIARAKEHSKESSLKASTHKNNWLNKLKAQGHEPIRTILCTAQTEEELNDLEIKFIKEYRERGYDLTNGTDGGEGALGRKTSLETKEKISDKRKEYYQTLKDNGKEIIMPSGMTTKNEHIMIDGIAHKCCSTCKIVKKLDEYGKYHIPWDGLNRNCRQCTRLRKRDYDQKNRNNLTEDEWKQSYKNRQSKISESIKTRFETDPEYKKKISKIISKEIIGIHIITGERIEFESALKAKEFGYSNASIGIAIKIGRTYKDYKWYFKKDYKED